MLKKQIRHYIRQKLSCPKSARVLFMFALVILSVFSLCVAQISLRRQRLSYDLLEVVKRVQLSNLSDQPIEEQKYRSKALLLLQQAADPNVREIDHSQFSLMDTIMQWLVGTHRREDPQEQGRTALMIAANNGDIALVQALVEKGANVNMRDRQGRTALLMAAAWDYAEIVKFLISHGADPNIARNDGWTPLIYAAGTANLDSVKILLAAGADINAKSQTGTTALSLIREHSRPDRAEIVKEFLLKAAARP